MSLKKSFLIILIAATTNNALAEDSLILEKNQPAPYRGVLMPLESVQELRRNSLELDNLKLLNASLDRSIKIHLSNEEILEKKISILTDQNLKLHESVSSARSFSSIERIGYFALGVLVTGLTSYGIYKAAITK